jgi:hypothetical protein
MRRLSIALLVGMVGCAGASTLEVNVQTEGYAAGADFDAIRICLFPHADDAPLATDAAVQECQTVTAERGSTFAMGRRVASFPRPLATSSLEGALLLGGALVQETGFEVGPSLGLATLTFQRAVPDAGMADAYMSDAHVCTAEICDLIDNDCNGACDEGAEIGCFQAIRRFRYDNNHIYVSPTEYPWNVLGLPEAAFVNELAAFSVAREPRPGLVALYRCRIPALTFLSRDIDCEGSGGTASAPLGYIALGNVCGAVPLIRYEHATTGTHLYLKDGSEVPANYVRGTAVGYVWP